MNRKHSRCCNGERTVLAVKQKATADFQREGALSRIIPEPEDLRMILYFDTAA